MTKFDVLNIGAVGTFVVRKSVRESMLRNAIAQKLPFKCEIIIIPGPDLLKLAATDPFSPYPLDPNITRFVNVLAKPIERPANTPLAFPSEKDWLLRIIAIENRFVLGIYKRDIKSVRYLGIIEKQFGVPATNRNWNTIEKVVQILQRDPAV
ncbi:MAG: hypothetical protein ACJ8M1_14335 [Chthoniobacterales bacterium]